MRDPTAKQALLEIGDNYDQLAEQAAALQASNSPIR